MRRRTAAVLAIAALAGSSTGALAQQYSYEGAMAELNAHNAQLRQTEQQVIYQAMQDPRVQWEYQQYLQRGGQWNFQQFATWHAYTAGGTRPFQPNIQQGPVYGTMRQGVYDARGAVISGGEVVQDSNGQCWIQGGTSHGTRVAC